MPPISRQAQDRERERQEALKDPAALRERQESRTRFGNLDAASAVGLIRDHQTPLKRLRAFKALELGADERVERYIGDHAAQVRLQDGTAVVTQTDVPMRVKDKSGALRMLSLRLDEGTKAFSLENPWVDVRIPRRFADPVELPGLGLGLSLAGNASDVAGEPVGGAVVYPNSSVDIDTVVQPIAAGTELNWVVRSERAPEQFSFTVDGTDEQSVSLADGVSGTGVPGIDVLKDGKPVAHVMPSVAVDSDGTSVDVEMHPLDNAVVVTVAHHGKDLHYPLLIDPPVIDFRHWSNGDQNVLGWAYQTSSVGSFIASLSTSGNPSGAYVGAVAGYLYGAGHYGEWVQGAPHESYVMLASYYYARHDADSTNFIAGIWDLRNNRVEPNSVYRLNDGDEQPGWFSAGGSFSGQKITVCAATACSWDVGGSGNFTFEGLQIATQHVINAPGALAYVGAAETRFYDRDVPTFQVLSDGIAPNNNKWVDAVTYQVTTRLTDPGLARIVHETGAAPVVGAAELSA